MRVTAQNQYIRERVLIFRSIRKESLAAARVYKAQGKDAAVRFSVDGAREAHATVKRYRGII